MLRARSFLIDGEAVACDGNGLPVFDRLRYRRQDGRVSCIQAPSRDALHTINPAGPSYHVLAPHMLACARRPRRRDRHPYR
jgi:hypothetical protein